MLERELMQSRGFRNVAIVKVPTGFEYGVSLHSYTDDCGVTMGLDDCMADMGATGVEILGKAHFPVFPDPTSAWMDNWFPAWRNTR